MTRIISIPDIREASFLGRKHKSDAAHTIKTRLVTCTCAFPSNNSVRIKKCGIIWCVWMKGKKLIFVQISSPNSSGRLFRLSLRPFKIPESLLPGGINFPLVQCFPTHTLWTKIIGGSSVQGEGGNYEKLFNFCSIVGRTKS